MKLKALLPTGFSLALLLLTACAGSYENPPSLPADVSYTQPADLPTDRVEKTVNEAINRQRHNQHCHP